MFTGIIEVVGEVRAAQPEAGGLRLGLATPFSDLSLGESVATNGVCLTVAQVGPAGEATFFASPETLARTSLGQLAPGAWLNLERAVTLGTRLSGHLVQGHVDGVGRLVEVVDEGAARRARFSLPASLRRYCVEKGSIAIDGISLTLNTVDDPRAGECFAVGVTLVPHTWTHPNLQHASLGDLVNVEVDVLAKYVERLCHAYPTPSNA